MQAYLAHSEVNFLLVRGVLIGTPEAVVGWISMAVANMSVAAIKSEDSFTHDVNAALVTTSTKCLESVVCLRCTMLANGTPASTSSCNMCT